MRLSSFLLAAGLSSSAFAVDASLDPWDIDPSCNGFENDIKDALTQSIDLAEAARTSLEFLLAKMPDRNSDPDGALKWARISSAANSIFGLMPNYKGHNAETEKYITDLRDIYAKTANTLPSSQNNPAHGFNPILSQKPGAKPMIVCGDAVFKWYDVDQEPEPGVGKVGDQPAVKSYIQNGGTIAGAFYHANRWDFRKTKDASVGHCIGNREALISSRDDLLIICDKMTSDAGKARITPRQYKSTAALGDHIMTNWVSNPTQLYHELMHWFGGVQPGTLKHVIVDQIAVNEKGQMRFKDKNGVAEYYNRMPTDQELSQKGQRKQGAYGLRWVMNLARTYTDKGGNKSPWSGPKLATKNADSLALFSFMIPIPSPVNFPSPSFSMSGGYSPGPHSPCPADSPYFGPELDWRDYRQQIPTLPLDRPRALTPPGFRDDDSQRPAAAFQQSSWFKVPANLRRDILRLAFGDKRLHMHLAFDPSALDRDDPEKKVWSWNGCICVRKYDPKLGPMTRGGLNPGPWIDRCCDPINVPNPPPENIGIMGWLRSCRQNYAETIDLLYSTNTILLSGEATISHLKELINVQHLNAITSLEIKCPINDNSTIGDIIAHLRPNPVSTFPNLKRLYISMEWGGKDNWAYGLKDEIVAFDSLVRQMHRLEECAFALPFEWFSDFAAHTIRNGNQTSYSQLWRALVGDGGDENVAARGTFEAVRLPHVDSYPKPPYHLGDTAGVGYWILEACELPLGRFDSISEDFWGQHIASLQSSDA
ncbi:hypothetical protein FBEOM_4451 [Fusarium beomiforme]|uniref:DUF7730 domain-containing protein n=1 Tax=Fusarium beomiforme TaxID=44412 RepID=A0A9P5E0H2_9HYPO|nr:hypothetical protein FBEOM_4451 [Fusarium beomiforme]